MATYTLQVFKYNQEGDMAHEYRPLRNVLLSDSPQQETDYEGNTMQPKDLADFVTTEIPVKLDKPLNIECQPSYDGTVNLIINDDENPPRIINTRFSVTEDNRYKIINRNQKEQTNIYEEGYIDRETRLFRNINKIPRISLSAVNAYGQLKGGNYTFYIKFADNDYNKTDVVAESGQVSIFKGTVSKINTVSGTLQDERTDKAILLKIDNIDTSFQKIYLYYSRESCDVNGARITEFAMIKEPYEITNDVLDISVNGYEEIEKITEEELNIQYNVVTAVKTQTQVQSMLFFGNVQDVHLNNVDLQALSYYIQVSPIQALESIGYVTTDYNKQDEDDIDQVEYYNPMNVYYRLGYWPSEIYRLGIVYIMKDDSLSPAFNLRGCEFKKLNDLNYNTDVNAEYGTWYNKEDDEKPIVERKINYIPKNKWIDDSVNYENTMGVFRMPKEDNEFFIQGRNLNTNEYETKPWGLKFEFPKDLWEKLKLLDVKGFFFVRQKRIPTTLCQGFSIGIDRTSYIPTPYIGEQENGQYRAESFINKNGTLTTELNNRLINSNYKQISGLLSVDTFVQPTLQSTFDGSQFYLEYSKQFQINEPTVNNRHYEATISNKSWGNVSINTGIIYINEDTPFKYLNNQSYSTRVGAAEEVKQIGFLDKINYNKDANNLLRGIYTAFLGTNANLTDSAIYNIKIQNFSEVFLTQYFEIRGNDNSPFYAISDRYEIENVKNTPSYECYRGDCYTCTVTTRINRNFIDSDVPVNNIIVEPNTWKNNYNGYNTTTEEEWLSINRADINSVPMGMWLTWKCYSNYNLSLRSQDSTNVEEVALMGNPRSFYPLSGASASVGNKVAESSKYNDGYSSTVGRKRYLGWIEVPYEKDMLDNRIMFSNVQQNDAFRNAYRIFQGLSYKDIDRQYGGIVKMITWGANILCIFEHGISIIPINEKALISTNTGQSIHMYGAEVIQDQLSVISQDYGSIWPESIIRTPMGVYGVDTYAKKIWRFSQNKGLELISDAKIQRFLNDHIKLREKDKYPIIALKNVKTHYNNYKGDVMFTFYNESDDEEWNICYNERLDKWITRYSWIPLYSENVNNIYCSLDKKRAEILAYVYDNLNATNGLTTPFDNPTISNQWDRISELNIPLKMVGSTLFDKYEYKIINIESSYVDKEEIFITLPESDYTLTNSVQTKTANGILTLHPSAATYEGHNLYYWKINLLVTPYNTATNSYGTDTIEVIGIVTKYDPLNIDEAEYKNIIQNGFYVHGRAGIFDEIDYFDEDKNNQILPTKWYNKQEPFEFEFVVNNATGMHKIFNNLVIISNKVKPKELEFEILGDVYHFNKAGIYWKQNDSKLTNPEWDSTYNKPIELKPDSNTEFVEGNDLSKDSIRRNWVKSDPKMTSEDFKTAEIKWDPILNQYTIVTPQTCYDINEYGRMRGNIQYKEDSWYTTIEPILYKKADGTVNEEGNKIYDTGNKALEWKSARIRDKWLKIRVKYSGEDLAIITAIKTMMTLSYS